MTTNDTVRSEQQAGAVALFGPIHAKAEWDALLCLLEKPGTARAELFAVRLVVLLYRRLACSQEKRIKRIGSSSIPEHWVGRFVRCRTGVGESMVTSTGGDRRQPPAY